MVNNGGKYLNIFKDMHFQITVVDGFEIISHFLPRTLPAFPEYHFPPLLPPKKACSDGIIHFAETNIFYKNR